MVRQFGFIEFMEASAKDGREVEAIFEKIISVVSQKTACVYTNNL